MPSTGLLREARTTRAPAAAASLAVTKPIPLDAPVITMTCSLSAFNLTSSTSLADRLLRVSLALVDPGIMFREGAAHRTSEE